MAKLTDQFIRSLQVQEGAKPRHWDHSAGALSAIRKEAVTVHVAPFLRGVFKQTTFGETFPGSCHPGRELGPGQWRVAWT
jgi:hypothetical protein